jgi:L-malate glycosyltransferase
VTKRIIFFHMLNDNSGSPKMLSVIISGLISRGFKTELYTSAAEGGFLSEIPGLRIHTVYYRFFENRLLTFLLYACAQLRYLISALGCSRKSDTVIYVNTIMPWGAIIGARLRGIKVICHVHENFVKKNIIHRLSAFILKKYATRAVFVSDYLFNQYDMDPARKVLIYNSLSDDFYLKTAGHRVQFVHNGNILMACSLKIYKGVNKFIELAYLLPGHTFTLLLNSDSLSVEKYFRNREVPDNLKVISGINNLHGLYQNANLVVNLSIPDKWIESFGLTLLEAMAYGIPVISPPVGGPAELVRDGYNGYKVDSGNIKSVADKITLIFSDRDKYLELSANARITASDYKYDLMMDKIVNEISFI